MEKQFSYRITKIAGRAVAVASIGLAAVFSLTAQADTVYLGSQYGYTTTTESSTRVYANGTGWNDTWVVNQDHSNAQYVYSLNENPVVPNSQTSLGLSTTAGSYGVSQNRSGDIFYGNAVSYTYGNNSNAGYALIGNVNVTIGGVFDHACGDGAGGFVSCGFGWADAKRESVYTSNKFAQIEDLNNVNINSYNFGVGSTVDNVTRGSKAYAYFVDSWTNGDNVAYASLGYESGGAAQAVGGYAINILGLAGFAGNNTINGDVSSAANFISGSNVVFNGNITSAGGLIFTTAGSATINGGFDLTGSVNYQGNDATLTLSNGSKITGNVINSGTDNGTLVFEDSGEVTGTVGVIKSVNVKGAGALVQLNTASGDTTVNTLTISADKAVVEVGGKLTGNVNMGGHFSKLELLNGPSANAGMTGTLDFGQTSATNGRGTLEVGDAVNVTFGAGGITLANAANSTLLFAGSSTVTGDVGSSVASATPNKIYAGAGTVTFNGLVTVGAGALNVGPTVTTVVLNQGLVGNLVFGTGSALSDLNANLYSSYGDSGVGGSWGAGGVVEVANGKNVTGSITTINGGSGDLKFMGSSAYLNDIGASGLKLSSVAFNAATAGTAGSPVISTITKDVYANLVTIGNGSAFTTATMTPGAHILGNNLTLQGLNTVFNLDGAFNTGFTTLADGTLSSASASKVTVQGGNITTGGATLNFSVDAGNVAAKSGQVVPGTSSSLTTTGTLVMSGTEKVNVALLGSTRNLASATLIGVGSNPTLNGPSPAPSAVTDNSFVIDTQVAETAAGLVMTTTRTNAQYISKSGTGGHFSNAAATVLGTLAATGANYGSDMQTVFNKLDIDQWGFGNTLNNLATQVKRLAPVANASGAQSALASTSAVLNSVGERLSVLRGDVTMAGLNGNGRQMGSDKTGWVKVLGSSGEAEAVGTYDGFKLSNSGVAMGVDAKVGNGVVGGSFGYMNSNISQQDFRLGDTAKMLSTTLSFYGTQEYGDAFVDGALAFGTHTMESNRATAVARIAKADTDMNQTTLKLSAGYRIGIDNSKVNVLTPLVSIEAASLKQKAYTETGAGDLSLNVASKNLSRTRASLGLRFNTTLDAGSNTLYPEFLVAVNRNNGLRNTDVVANYVGDTSVTSFTTTGVVLPKSSYTVGAGLRFATSKNSEMQVGYRYEGGNGLVGRSAQVRGSWSF